MTVDGELLVRHGGREVRLEPQRRNRIGTNASHEVKLDGPDRGPEWATMRMVGGWHVRPLDGTEVAVGSGPWRSRPTLIEGDGPVLIRLRRDGREAELEVRRTPAAQTSPAVQPPPDPRLGQTTSASPPVPAAPRAVHAAHGPSWITIGREGGGADVQLTGLDIALSHARYRRRPDGSLEIRDLSHGLGVFAKGRPVMVDRLEPGESFIIGHHRFLVGPDDVTVQAVRRSPVLQCQDLVVTYLDNETPRLKDIGFALDSDGFVAVIGPSGAGKSTLFRALLGEVEQVTGAVSFAGAAVTASGLPGSLVSFLPQDDHLPSELTARQAVRCAAHLRLAADLTEEEVCQRIDDVMTRLELTQHADSAIPGLSGGTRKRVSLALELLTEPILLILDEPTSGLDEGLDQRLMRQLATLARNGTAILVVTHSMVNLDECDQVLAITGLGTCGYLGPPQQILSAFGAHAFADVMEKLRAGQSSGVAHQSTGITTASGRPSAPPPPRRRETPVLAAREMRRFVPASGSSRGWRRLIRPSLHLVLAPLLVAVLACLAGPDGLAATARAPNDQLTVVLSILSITAAFFAAAVTSGSIVSDYEMIRREERWGIRTGSVVTSRFLVLGTVALIQGALAGVLLLALRPGPSYSHPVPGPALVIVSLCLLCVASAAAGLFVSALSRTVQQGVFALMLLSVTQVVLAGLVVPLGEPKTTGDWVLASLSVLTPIRWAVSALGSGLNLNAFSRLTPDTLWSHDLLHVAGAWAAMVVLTVAFLAGAQRVLLTRIQRRI